jgi:hypothetical protein
MRQKPKMAAADADAERVEALHKAAEGAAAPDSASPLGEMRA